MIVEIALCVGAGALAVLVGLLVPLLIQLRKPVAQSEYLLVRMNAELPLLLKEMRAATENLNMLVEQARGGGQACDSTAACGGGTRRHCATGPRDDAGYESIVSDQAGQHGGGIEGHDGRP